MIQREKPFVDGSETPLARDTTGDPGDEDRNYNPPNLHGWPIGSLSLPPHAVPLCFFVPTTK